MKVEVRQFSNAVALYVLVLKKFQGSRPFRFKKTELKVLAFKQHCYHGKG